MHIGQTNNNNNNDNNNNKIIVMMMMTIITIIIIIIKIITIIIIILIIIIIIIIIIFISRGSHSKIQDLIFAAARRFKDYTFHASGHRVKNCSSMYSFLNDERDGAIFVVKDKEFHFIIPW